MSPTPAHVLAAMKDHRVDVIPYKGWDRRGSTNPCKAVLVHHTATASASESNPAPSLGWAVSAYDKPVANALVGKVPGSTYLLAAMNGASYHCGNGGPWEWAGIPVGNRPDLLWGIEIDDPGRTFTLTDYQVTNTARMVAALWDVFGWTDPRSITTHKCWTDVCHMDAAAPGPHRGRKNDTLDGNYFGEWPCDPNPTRYNAPYWREKVAAELDTKSAIWDGTVPSRSAVMRTHPDTAEVEENLAAWRLRARLADLGYTSPEKVPVKKLSRYPRSAMERFRAAQGWDGDGLSARAQKRIFGKDKP